MNSALARACGTAWPEASRLVYSSLGQRDLPVDYRPGQQLAGFVIDGAVRDTAEFADGGLCCFAHSAVHRSPSKEGPNEINVPPFT